MGKRTLLPAGLIIFSAALSLEQLIRAGAQNAELMVSVPASGTDTISAAQQYPEEAPFLTENGAAMNKMMAGMDVKPTGDVDADFAAMMIPHHQGAIDMAMAELRYGKNEQLRRIAQEIIVDQQQEIVAMRLALGQSLPASAPALTQIPAYSAAPPHSHSSTGPMSMSPAKKPQ